MKKWINKISLVLVILLLSGCIETTNANFYAGKDQPGYTYSTHHDDEQYYPKERDLFRIVLSALHDADTLRIDTFSDRFLAENLNSVVFLPAGIMNDYEVKGYKSEEVESYHYITANRQFISYDDETDQVMKARDIDTRNGEKWQEFEYDTFIEFEFDLERVIKLKNGKEERQLFRIRGDFPPYFSYGSTKWYIGNLTIEAKENKGNKE